MIKGQKRYWEVGLGYQYAPETCFVSELQRDGSYRKVDVDLTDSMCGYYMAIGEKDRAYAEVKRIMRGIRRGKKRVVTFGFFIKGSNHAYVYCNDRSVFANEYNIKSKLNAFKVYKQHWLDCDCKHHTATTAKLDGKYDIESVEKEFVEIDFSRPLKVYVNLI